MTLSSYIDQKLNGKTPSEIVYISLGVVLTAKLILSLAKEGQIIKRLHKAKWRAFRVIAAPIIEKKIKAVGKDMKMPAKEGEFKAKRLPENGMTEEQVLQLVNTAHNDLDQPYEKGGFSGAVYHGAESHTHFISCVMDIFQWSNPLHSDIFGATRKMEAEVVSMVVHMYNGHLLPDACGTVTSGGTESIMMALKTYRDWGRATRGIKHPSVIIGITAHPAFDKGAEYFGIELIKVPVNQSTQRVDAKEMEKYIKHNTVAIVGSAPSFPHGMIDPISELADVAYRHNIGLHVDCCLGGFIVPFMEKAGFPAPVIDFRLPGVTTISCDTHKYGYAPKGTSTVLYRTKELRSHQFCCVADWPGGIYCSPAVSGSKPGNVIAGTWAAMVHIGVDGYVNNCRKIMEARIKMTTAIREFPYIEIIGNPTASVFAFTCNLIDIYVLGDRLGEKGWVLNRLQFPSGLQFSVTLLQTQEGVVERFIEDVRSIGDVMYEEMQKALKDGKKIPQGATGATMYGSQQRVSDRSSPCTVIHEGLRSCHQTQRTGRVGGIVPGN